MCQPAASSPKYCLWFFVNVGKTFAMSDKIEYVSLNCPVCVSKISIPAMFLNSFASLEVATAPSSPTAVIPRSLMLSETR